MVWAIAVLGELYAAGEIDPETLGIYARTRMDRYNATEDNAATKSLLLDEKETAQQLAQRVQKPLVLCELPEITGKRPLQ